MNILSNASVICTGWRKRTGILLDKYSKQGQFRSTIFTQIRVTNAILYYCISFEPWFVNYVSFFLDWSIDKRALSLTVVLILRPAILKTQKTKIYCIATFLYPEKVYYVKINTDRPRYCFIINLLSCKMLSWKYSIFVAIL